MPSPKPEQRHYPVARIVEIHDGDTFRIDVDCGFSVHAYVWVRLLDVRAPELSEPGGQEAKQAVDQWLRVHSPDGYVSVITYKTAGKGKEIREQMTFIRYVAMVVGEDGSFLNAWLRDQGYIDKGM